MNRHSLTSTRQARSALAAALACALLAGCGSVSLADGVASHSPWVTVTDGQAGSTVVLRAGQELIVRLRTEPTTGYDWSLAGPPSSVLTPVGKPTFERDVLSSTADASVGDEVWRFRALGPGSATVRFESHRAREVLTEPARQAVYTVRVE